MADISSNRVIYTPDIRLTADSTLSFGKNYLLDGNITVTLPNVNMVDGGSIKITKRQGDEPILEVLSGSGHTIRFLNKRSEPSWILDEEIELELFWNDNDVRWEM